MKNGRYESASAVQALAGTSPVLYQSGKYRFARQRRACIKFLRRALQLFAYQSVRLVSWARAYYAQKRAAGKSHHEALRALANIWVRKIYRHVAEARNLQRSRLPGSQGKTCICWCLSMHHRQALLT